MTAKNFKHTNGKATKLLIIEFLLRKSKWKSVGLVSVSQSHVRLFTKTLISLPPSATKIPSRPRLHLTGATHDFTENLHLRSERRSRMTQGVSCHTWEVDGNCICMCVCCRRHRHTVTSLSVRLCKLSPSGPGRAHDVTEKCGLSNGNKEPMRCSAEDQKEVLWL